MDLLEGRKAGLVTCCNTLLIMQIVIAASGRNGERTPETPLSVIR